MSLRSEQLQREIDETHARIDATIDELGKRLDVKHQLHEARDWLSAKFNKSSFREISEEQHRTGIKSGHFHSTNAFYKTRALASVASSVVSHFLNSNNPKQSDSSQTHGRKSELDPKISRPQYDLRPEDAEIPTEPDKR